MSDIRLITPSHRHVKTGRIYEVLCIGLIESTLEESVVYVGLDHQIWIRPKAEFEDGRFEEFSLQEITDA